MNDPTGSCGSGGCPSGDSCNPKTGDYCTYYDPKTGCASDDATTYNNCQAAYNQQQARNAYNNQIIACPQARGLTVDMTRAQCIKEHKPDPNASPVPGLEFALSVASLFIPGGGEVDAAAGVAKLLRMATGSGGRKLAMSMGTVEAIAAKFGINIEGQLIKINKVIRALGSTTADGTITLYRDAFASEKELAITLVHELEHVKDLAAGMPYPAYYDPNSAWEIKAEKYAQDWWNSLNL